MNGTIPHIVQYQGSKRILAPQILKYMPQRFNRLVEPFAGMAAMTIATAKQNRAGSYVVNDINSPVVKILQSTIETPQIIVDEYAKIWCEQFDYPGGSVEHYYKVRKEFNEGNQSAAMMLYLLARCVKGSVRYGSNGHFNQSPDKRRYGMTPKSLKKNVEEISWYLKDKTTFMSMDYREVLELTKKGDVVYMDPPYQGVSNVRDSRYLSGISFYDFIDAVDRLNMRGVDFIISYDGSCGEKTYGKELPLDLGLEKIMLNAGFSSQSILLGKKETTYEALYISRGLQETNALTTNQKQAVQLDLFAV